MAQPKDRGQMSAGNELVDGLSTIPEYIVVSEKDTHGR
jgi:hypothetical protein